MFHFVKPRAAKFRSHSNCQPSRWRIRCFTPCTKCGYVVFAVWWGVGTAGKDFCSPAVGSMPCRHWWTCQQGGLLRISQSGIRRRVSSQPHPSSVYKMMHTVLYPMHSLCAYSICSVMKLLKCRQGLCTPAIGYTPCR